MAVTLKKNFNVDLKVYNNYIKDYEAKIAEIHKTLNELYDALDGCIMNKQYWCDDNALDFVKWFKLNYNTSDSYEATYATIKTVFSQTGRAVCTEIMKSQPTSYSKYAYIKKYAGKGSIWDALEAKYKSTKVNKMFTNTTVTNNIKADKMVVDIMYKAVIEKTNKLRTLGDELGNMVLAFGVGNKGVSIDGLDCSAKARLIARLSVFNSPLKKKLQECITKTNGLDGIVNVTK